MLIGVIAVQPVWQELRARTRLRSRGGLDAVLCDARVIDFELALRGALTFDERRRLITYQEFTMTQLKRFATFILMLVLASVLGCASTRTQEGTGEYIDDTAITAKVKGAVLNEPTLKSAEINVETFKGVVQLSGFVNSQSDINKAVEVARGVAGVKSVKNDMRLK